MTWRTDIPTQPNQTLRMVCVCGHTLKLHGMSAPSPCDECHCGAYRHSHDTNEWQDIAAALRFIDAMTTPKETFVPDTIPKAIDAIAADTRAGRMELGKEGK